LVRKNPMESFKTQPHERIFDIHSTAREGSKERKIPGKVVIFTIPVTPSSINQTNVTESKGKERIRGEGLKHSLGANVKPSLDVPKG
jgi:hypothetical protein